MLSEELRERIKALKKTIPDGRIRRSDVVVDLTETPIVDLSDGRDEPTWIADERIVDLFPPAPQAPAKGLGTVPPLSARVFHTLDDRDRELAHLVAAGMSDEEIAFVLDMTPAAVELAVRSLLSLTGFATRPAMIIGWHAGR